MTYVAKANIDRFKKLLQGVLTTDERRTLEHLLFEEEAKLEALKATGSNRADHAITPSRSAPASRT
jgi:hypothetical protein